MTTWMVKWGVIAAVASVAAGWIGGGVVPSLAGMALDMLNGHGQDAAGGTRGSRQNGRARPQAWESFDQHWEWHSEEQLADATSPAQHVQHFVADALQRAKDGGWWSVARGALQSFSDPKPPKGDVADDSADGDWVDPDGERLSEPQVRSESI